MKTNPAVPDIFIVGAPKAGTTSLFNYLTKHPAVHIPLIKETHLYSNDIDIEKFRKNYNYQKVKDINDLLKKNQPLHVTYLRNENDYLSLYKSAEGKLKIDGSTSYLFSTSAAKNIYRNNPEAKIIMILRQPVDRAYSHYLMDKKNSWVDGEFPAAVLDDYNQTNKGWGMSNLYVELGLYYDQVKRMQQVFPEEQILILFYDDLKNDSSKVMSQVFDFIGVSQIQIDTNEKSNTAALPRNNISAYLNSKRGFKRNVKKFLPQNILKELKNIFFTNKKPELKDEWFNKLIPYFGNDIQLLSQLLNKDLSHWLKP